VKKRKIKAITAFKVIEVGTNRKPVYATSYYSLIVTDILSRTVSELSQLLVQISDTAFSSPPFGGAKGRIQVKSVTDHIGDS